MQNKSLHNIIDGVFKAFMIVILSGLVSILYGIYNKMDSKIGRFQPSNSLGTLDTKTGTRYVYTDDGYIMLDNKGNEVPVKKLPE